MCGPCINHAIRRNLRAGLLVPLGAESRLRTNYGLVYAVRSQIKARVVNYIMSGINVRDQPNVLQSIKF